MFCILFLPPEIPEDIEVPARHYAQNIVQKNISAHQSEIKKRGITVIMDAGIATEKNLTLLFQEGYDYIIKK